MDDKEVRIDSGLGTSIHNDCNKRLPNGNATYTSRDKSYPDSSHPLGKTDSRPCAIIGPDRVLPSPESNDMYMKTIPPEPWEYPDNYRHPYDSIKMSEYHQTHNISPRQTFQENMQRVMVPPTYSNIKSSDETSLKNPKLNVPTEGKYCDVPYSINMLNSEPKSVRSDSAMPAMNHLYVRGVQPHGWTGGVQPLKQYQAHDYYHNTEYSNCPAPRPMPIVQPQRIVHDEIHPMYTDRLYQESNIRFKPYPTSKEKFPQPRYDYSNTFQPPQNPIPKFDIQKSMHGHPYPMYPQGPYKYTVDRRYPEPMMETHPRALYPQHNAFRTHPVHPSYGPLPGNFYHNKPYPCPSDNPKSMHGNKLSYDANNKIYLELENPRYKGYPSPDNFYYNDRAKLMRGDILIPGHTQMNSMGQQHLYKKDNVSIKSIDHSPHYPYRDHRSIGNPLARMPLQFSPNTVSMSPCDSNTSNEAVMLGMPQEDCGYVSQSSTTSIRSMDSNNGHADFYRRHGFNYASTNQNAFHKENNSKPPSSTDSKKGLNLSQFFQMWNEGDEEDTAANNNNDNQINSNYVLPKPPANNNQEQLYILGSITVPQEELSKYEHLQKVSKLPENIKGYNNIEILNQFEQLVESPGMNNSQVKIPPLKEYKVIPQTYTTNQIKDGTQRPVSPLDVEAKISQSVIHKEVGCNFEIKPCSPKVLNVDVAAPVHDVLGERFIEKVANPVMLNLGKDAENKIEIVDKSMNVTSCKMANGKYNQNHVNSAVVKPLYPLQDINANMGVCLASLPQLDSDIDLNLPEVNQQFIDANKIEITSRSPHQIVPMLENDHPDNSYARNINFSQIHNEGPGPMADQEITKLSKYRKTKRTDTVNNPILSSSSLAQRTDSVIIKNPENVKLCQESQNESLEVVKNIVLKTTQENNNAEIVKNDACSENNEMAIDFSVNRKEDAKTVNTKREIGIANANISKKSQFCPSNMNLSVKENRKTKKSKNSSDSKSIANYFGQQDESFTNYDHNSDSYCTSEEKTITNNKTHEEFIASKELSKMQFEDYQSETSNLTHRELNEPLKEQKLHKEHKTEIIKEEERLVTDNLLLNRCDDINKLPDLSFELATDSNQQLTHTPLNCNSDQRTDYSKLENIPDVDFKNNTSDVQITKLDETSNYSANKHAREVDTSKLVDTIEKELQQMDAKSDAIIDSFSEMNHPVTIEANSKVLLQENLSKTNTSLNVSVIKSSDRSYNIKNKEFSNIHETTDIIINENLSESHNKDILESSLFTCHDKDTLISDSPISENNLNYKKEFLLDSQLNTKNKDEILISENDNTNLNKKLEINTSDNINSEDSIVEMNEFDRNFKDCKSPVTETTCDQSMQELNTENNCNQKQQAIENDNNKREIACALQSMQELNTENNCNQKQQAIENDNNKRDIACALQSMQELNTENNCNQKQQAIENDNNKRDIACALQSMQELNTENNCNQKQQAIENDNNKRDIACALQSMQELNTENNCNQKQQAIENDNNKRDIACALQSMQELNTENNCNQKQQAIENDTNKRDIACALQSKQELNTENNCNQKQQAIENDNNKRDIACALQSMQELNTENNCNQKQQAIENDNNKRDIACALQSMKELNTENNCNQKQQAIENDNNKRDIACALQSNCDDKQSTDYEKLNSAYYKQRVHRKALFSPWVQNLILYNTDNKMLCSDKNKAEADILDHQVRLDENINFAGISNSQIHEEELNYTIENVEANMNEIKMSETVDVVQAIHESKNDISENLDNFEEKRELDEKILCNTSCTDLKQTHPVRCLSPLTFSNNNTKLLKRTSKRSLSDSALISGFQEDESLSTKRSKRNERGVLQPPSIETNLTNISRRNSISEIYNDGNVVILIDKDLILTEESQDTNICFAEVEESTDKYDSDREIIDAIAENLPQYEKELWVDDDDVACTETVFSDDVAEDVVIGTPSSPKGYISSNYETVNKESFMLCEEVIKNMENDVDMDELKISHDSTYSNNLPYDYHDSTVDDIFTCLESPKDSESFAEDKMESNRRKAETILNHFETSTALFPKILPLDNIMQDDKENVDVLDSLIQETESDIILHTNTLNVQPNSGCEDYEDYSCTLSTSNYSSSPEVTSTTCEDKSPGIVLKISNHKRSKSSQLDNSKPAVKSNISYKLTEKKKYKPNVNSSGTLITKAAQKYIPPIKITISDLKVKLPLPKNSLDKLKQLKTSKVEPKKDKKPTKTYSLSAPRESKKPKQKFEDVLMSIDKFQYNYSKVKNKKARDQIPKVVIKKNETGSHYTSSSSSSSDDTQSPDLTGRKWQPWVFIEKNTFIDKMALKHKVKAIYCPRKKSYILSEKFRKYKSVYNAKFVISQPKSDDSDKGNLKYTIRLKHH